MQRVYEAGDQDAASVYGHTSGLRAHSQGTSGKAREKGEGRREEGGGRREEGGERREEDAASARVRSYMRSKHSGHEWPSPAAAAVDFLYPMCGSSAVTMPMDPCASSLHRSSFAVMSFTHLVRRVDMPQARARQKLLATSSNTFKPSFPELIGIR